MAANSKSRALFGIGNRLVCQIGAARSTDPARSASLLSRKGVHVSVYDKNVDDQVRPSVVPDNVIKSDSDKYWAPDPLTGVFGPGTEHSTAAGSKPGLQSSSVNGGEDSVLGQKAFFRPLEDLEKPVQV